MKIVRTSLLAAPFAALLATGAIAQDGEGYWQKVQSAGELRCGAAVAPPWVMRDPASGEYGGVFSDLCRKFADTLGVKPVFVDTTWDNIVAGLQAGKWDMSMALNQTPARAMAVTFSVPVVQYEISLAYNKDNPKLPANPVAVTDIDIEGVTVAVMSGTAQDKAVSAALQKATVLRLPTSDENRLAVQSRRADVLVDDSSANDLWVQANPDWAVSFRPEPALAKQGMSFGLAPRMSAADQAVPNIFITEEIAVGQVDKLTDAAIKAVLGTN